MPSKPTSKSVILHLGVGIAVMIMCYTLLYIFSEKISNVLFSFFMLLSFIAALMIMSKAFTGGITYKNQIIEATGSYGLLIVILIASLKFDIFKPDTFDFTIYLVDQNRQISLKEGLIQLRLKNTPREEEIDNHGSVNFRGISSGLLGDSVDVEILNNIKWVFGNNSRTKKILLIDNNITLIVKRSDKSCCIGGTVINQSGKLVEGALVWIGSSQPAKTSINGRFKIELPLEMIDEDSYQIYVQKGKYKKAFLINSIQEPTIEIKE